MFYHTISILDRAEVAAVGVASVTLTTALVLLVSTSVLVIIGVVVTQLQNGQGLPRPADFRRFRHVWEVVFPDGIHRVELEHCYFSGKKQLWWDGELLESWWKRLNSMSVHRFVVGDHKCSLTIQAHGAGYKYNLAVDGLWLSRLDHEMGEPVPFWSVFFYVATVLPALLDPLRQVAYVATAYGLLGCRLTMVITKLRNVRIGMSCLMVITAWSIYLIFR